MVARDTEVGGGTARGVSRVGETARRSQRLREVLRGDASPVGEGAGGGGGGGGRGGGVAGELLVLEPGVGRRGVVEPGMGSWRGT